MYLHTVALYDDRYKNLPYMYNHIIIVLLLLLSELLLLLYILHTICLLNSLQFFLEISTTYTVVC